MMMTIMNQRHSHFFGFGLDLLTIGFTTQLEVALGASLLSGGVEIGESLLLGKFGGTTIALSLQRLGTFALQFVAQSSLLFEQRRFTKRLFFSSLVALRRRVSRVFQRLSIAIFVGTSSSFTSELVVAFGVQLYTITVEWKIK